jgi:UDP-N-acetylglucosamine 2-epimerase (non-hydrolysing)
MLWVLTGTRPDIIKLAPVCWELNDLKIPHLWVHSGQHYDEQMSGVFFQAVVRRTPDFVLDPCPPSPGDKVAHIKAGLDKITSACSQIVVLGDTITTLAGALFAVERKVPVIHVEAGLRSGDLRTPEELIRITVDNLSTTLFTTCQQATDNLSREGGISGDRIFQVGNTLIDAIHAVTTRDGLPERPDYAKGGYILLTLHRIENLSNRDALEKLFKALTKFVALGLKVIFPMHPHTEKVLDSFGMLGRRFVITMIPPQDFRSFMSLEMRALAIVTDSGSVQEEAYIHGVPCLVIRSSTERKETVGAKAAILCNFATMSCQQLDQAISQILSMKKRWDRKVYGSGGATTRLIAKLREIYGI